jgi:predicted secreted protein
VVEQILRLVNAHEILRTTFVTNDQGFRQIIRPDASSFEVPHVVVDELSTFLDEDVKRGFSIGEKHFVRMSVATDASGSYVVLTIHHTLYDGWSLPLLVSDLCDAIDSKPIPSRPSFRSVVDYIEAQDKHKTEEYWREKLAGVSGSSIASTMTAESSEVSSDVPLSNSVPAAEVVEAAKSAGVTVAVLTKMAWVLTLRKFLRQNDIVIGQVLSNREMPVRGIER